MRIKSYYARTIEDAMARAGQELGPDAMLVDSRKSPPEALHLGAYEVVFAMDAARAEPGASATREAAANGFGDRLSAEVGELKKELEGMRRALTRTAFGPAQWPGASPTLSDGYATLTAGEVSPELAREIVQGAESRLGAARLPLARLAQRPDGAAFERALVEELESRFTVQPVLGRGEGKPRIVALVGPPGSGKTSTLVKLAVNYGLASRRPVLLLSADTYRVAAAEQLRSYAAILGVGFQVLETVAALAQAIEENRGKELIFIDTPGLSAGELEDSGGLAHFLATRTDIDTQLVLSASMKSADLKRVVDSYQGFGAQRLVFTKLDETSSFGPILNEAVRTGKPLSFFTNGQRIPEDLEAVSPRRLTELILNSPAGRTRSVA
jgi:flagellar biosynthesis protein FlhF